MDQPTTTNSGSTTTTTTNRRNNNNNNNITNNITNKSILLYIFSFLTVSLSSGLIYGYPHLRKNLLLNASNLTESQLGIIYTIGSWTIQGGRFFSGMARDKYGTRLITFTSLLCTIGGCIGIAFSNENNVVLLSISFFFVGLGSGGQLCLLPVANLFPLEWQGTIIASLAGAFQISGLVFLVLVRITIDRRISFGFFVICLSGLAVCSLILLPKDQFVRQVYDNVVDDDIEDEDVGVGDDNEENHSKNQTLPESDHINDHDDNNSNCNEVEVDQQIHEHEHEHEHEQITAIEIIKSKEYILLVSWFSITLIPMQYYIGTIGFQFEQKGDDDGTYIAYFSICYALSAVVSPILGKIGDCAGLGMTQMIGTVLIAFSMIFLLVNELSLIIHLVGMTCYGMGRMTIFGMFFTNVGKRFGYTHYGTLVGLGLFLSALVSLLQYPLIDLAATRRGDEFYVNLICAFVILGAGIPYCLWLSVKERREKGM